MDRGQLGSADMRIKPNIAEGVRGCLRAFVLLTASLFFLIPSTANSDVEVDDAAALFGQNPSVWGMRLSPDGQQVSFLRYHSLGFPVAMVINLRTGASKLVLGNSENDKFHVSRCEWANNTRLLCAYYGVWKFKGRARSLR